MSNKIVTKIKFLIVNNETVTTNLQFFWK